MRFDPQAQPENAARMSGCLLRKAGRFILVDQTANVVVELNGDATQLTAQLGNRVEIQGTVDASGQPAEGASQVVRVSALEEIGLGGCVAAAQGVGAEIPTRAPVPAAVAKSSHTTAIVAGVAVAAGGAVAAVVLLNSNKSKSPQPAKDGRPVLNRIFAGTDHTQMRRRVRTPGRPTPFLC